MINEPPVDQKVYKIMQDIVAYQQKQIDMVQSMSMESLMDKILDVYGKMLPKTCKYIATVPEDWDENEDSLVDVCDDLSCSNCGWTMKFDYDGWFNIEPPYNSYFNYCPNCGAKVEGIEYDQ